MLMSAVEIRAEISTYLEKVKDESFLKVVHSMLDTYLKEQEDPIVSYDIDGTPRRAAELYTRKTALTQIEYNRSIMWDKYYSYHAPSDCLHGIPQDEMIPSVGV